MIESLKELVVEDVLIHKVVSKDNKVVDALVDVGGLFGDILFDKKH